MIFAELDLVKVKPLADHTVRVLVVDDFDEWCHYVCATVSQMPSAIVVGQASNGIDAIQKAKELQPDVILLDIGLPDLNGFEVLGQLNSISPHSKVIFVTENRSPEIMEQAYRAGASGYVIKSGADSQLAAAIDAVLKRKTS